MLWLNDGKLVSKENTLINCYKCPCGKYSLFGFKYKQQNSCKYQFEVDFCEIIKNKITSNINSWFSQIELSGKSGLVVEKDIKVGNNTIELKVYNLFDDFYTYKNFCKLYYADSNITENAEGNYPYPTSSEASSVFQKYEKDFLNKYALNYKLKVKDKGQRWWLYGWYQEYNYIDEYYCYCGDDNQYDSDTPCPSECQQEIYDTTGGIIGIGAIAYREDDSSYYKFINVLPAPDGYEGEDLPYTCSDDVNIRTKLADVAEYAYSFVDKSDSYKNGVTREYWCTNSNDMCLSFQYFSEPVDNFYADIDNIIYQYRWKSLLLTKNEYTPDDVIGIKFKFYKTRTTYNNGNLADKDQQVTQSQYTDILYFDQQYLKLPFSKDFTQPTYVNLNMCKEDGDYNDDQWFQIQPWPIGGWSGYDFKYDSYIEKYNFSLEAIEYVKKQEK